MDSGKDHVWERLKRREELRKAETAAGGRKKYVSPLELFRMRLDAESAEGQETSGDTTHEAVARQQDRADEQDAARARDSDSEPDSEVVLPPPSPDDYEAATHLDVPGEYSEAHERDYTPEGRQRNRESVVFSKESWLKCVFPFKQRRKAMKSATKSFGLVEVSTASKDALFRNPLYKYRVRTAGCKPHGVQSETPGSNPTRGVVSKMSRAKSIETSDVSKTHKISAVSTGGRHSPVGGDSAKEYRESEKRDMDALMAEPDYTLLVEVYRRPGRFPFGRCQRDVSASPVGKSRSYRTVGALRKAMLKSRHCADAVNHAVLSASPEPSSLSHRSAIRSTLHRQDSCENAKDVVVGCQIGRKLTPIFKKKGSPTAGGAPVSHSTYGGRVANLMAMELDKGKTNVGSRSARGAEDPSGDTGYTAFVPFQGFAAFAHQGQNARADQTSFTRSLESQCSSVEGSRNSSSSRARHERRK